jgi:type IV pilus assembly protein PilC
MDTVGALEIVAGVVGNETWKRLVYETIREVNDGNPMATAFQRASFVPPMMVQMLSVGEGTGKTQDILMRVSNFYSREVDDMAGNMTKLIEPLVLLALGGGVGVMVTAILLPMYQLSSGG